MFPTEYKTIIDHIEKINPISYSYTRNYIDGDVTRLSPYISRGIISTRQIAESVLKRGYKPHQIEKFLQELAWRDYFQQVWRALGEAIDEDIKNPQEQVAHHEISSSLVQSSTYIDIIDDEIRNLYSTGYIHNHIRMYLASIACNVGRNHWYLPAKWMYYHLLDADWASNALSWQWVAGSFSSKKYYANQDNINKYTYSTQRKTFLDTSYEELAQQDIPHELSSTQNLHLVTQLPSYKQIKIVQNLPTYIYNFYNLDPQWDKNVNANRILLLCPEFFTKYPVSVPTIRFITALAQNIPNIQIYTGTFEQLKEKFQLEEIHYKEHPSNKNYTGIEHSRDWLFPQVSGYKSSFFAYWKKCQPLLDQLDVWKPSI
jgi:deoxyribodipyrimidine photo-lyase